MEKERNKTAIASSQPLITPGLDILKESWEIFKKVWKKFLGLLFVIPILSSLIWAVLMAFILVIYFLVGVFVGGPAAVAASHNNYLHPLPARHPISRKYAALSHNIEPSIQLEADWKF